jgi:anti-sigma factor RsiW
MPEQTHPDRELLDRLRAGLLDDDADTRAALEAHIADCPRCQANLDSWQQLGPDALGPALDAAGVTAGLQQARRSALASAGRRRPLSYAALAAAALLLMIISAGLLTLNTGLQQPQTPLQAAGEIPEVYEDIDFYLWLAGQQEKKTEEDEAAANRT